MNVFKSEDEFQQHVYDAVCTAEGYRCADGRGFTAFDFNVDAESENDLADSDIEQAFNACMNYIEELQRKGYYDDCDYEAVLVGHA